MSTRFSGWLLVGGVFSAGCCALLGEDFQGYESTKGSVGGGGGDASEVTSSSGSSQAGTADTTDLTAGAGSAGTADRGGDAGSAGMLGSPEPTLASADTSPECQADATLIPECTLYSAGQDFPPIPLTAANGLAVNATEAYGGGFSIYASKRASSTVTQLYTKNVEGTEWTPWFCFDALPKPDRLTVGALLNGLQEVMVTSRCGGLYRRVLWTDGSWLPWQQVSLPAAGSAVTDAAMSVDSLGTNYVYVADGGRAFVRHRVGSDSYSPYGAWQEIPGASGAKLLTAGLRSDLRQQVFTLDANGLVRTAIESTSGHSEFGSWSDFDSNQLPAPLIDIEAPHGGPFPLEVFAVDSNGTLWQRSEDLETAEFQPWTVWDGPVPPARLVSLSGAALKTVSGTPLQLAGVSAAGAVYTLKRSANLWLEWRRLQ